jgi:hypothetical protein
MTVIMLACKFLALFGACRTNIGTLLHDKVAELRVPRFVLNTKGTHIGTVTAQGNASQMVCMHHLDALGCAKLACGKAGKACVYHST